MITVASKTLVIRYGGENRALPVDDIYYAESQDHKVIFHLNKEETACYAKMKDVDQLLQGKFFRIHKGYLVNLMHIGRYTRTEVQLDNGEKLPLSKYRYPAFTDAYMGYLSGEDKQERRIQGSNSDHILKNAETDA